MLLDQLVIIQQQRGVPKYQQQLKIHFWERRVFIDENLVLEIIQIILLLVQV